MKFETPNGKVIETIICPRTAHVKVQFATGGELPEALSGHFTSVREAEKAIVMYIDSKEDTKPSKAKG